ncbi:MAG: type II toxin-antitoxin system RelE/ParE family toxin [bacterium]
MVGYEITLASSAEKEINSLPKNIQKKVEEVIDSLKENSRPHRAIKLKGKEGVYRIRIGDYRVIYTINDKKRLIDISYVRHRSKAYI